MTKRIKYIRLRLIGCLLLLAILHIASAGQGNTQFSQGQVDEGFSNKLSVPLMSYEGRGIDLPVTLNYSSSVWRIDNINTVYNGQWAAYQTITQAVYSEHATAGWKTSLDLPKVEWPKSNDLYTPGGRPCDPIECPSASLRIRRVTIHMPDGSSHELRENDSAYSGPIDMSGTFYAVDGSRLRYDSYDEDTGTLYMPDGTRYILDAGSGQIIDRNGNTLTYNATNRQWTDTLGRLINMPFPANPSATDYTYQLAGLAGVNGGVQTYTFKWRNLSDVLTPGSGSLGVMASHYLPYPNSLPTGPTGNNHPQQHGNIPSQSTYPNDSLFYSDGEDIPTLVVGKGQSQSQLFNPVVLHEIVLPDGRSYKFTYNIYGEITKAVYPTGAYEEYAIGAIGGSYTLSIPYDQAERGVSSRKLSESGTGSDILQWTYSKAEVGGGGWGNGAEGAYRYRAVAPDTTCSEIYKVKLPTPIHPGPFGFQYWDWNFTDPRNGATVETRSYSASATACGGSLLRRELTSYERTAFYLGTWSNGLQVYAYRNIRPVKNTAVLFEGSGSALAQTTNITYDTTYEYTTGVDQIVTQNYNYAVISNTSSSDTAQSGTINQIANGTLAKSTETQYSTNQTYRDANILGLPTKVMIRSGTAPFDIVSQSEMTYDDAGYVPTGTTRGLPTTMKTWDSTKGAVTNPSAYLVTHATFDNYGNRTIATDAKGYATTTVYDSTHHAYPISVTSPVPDDSGTHGSNSVFTTSISYDTVTGLVLSTTDINGQTSSMEYNDPLLRPTKVTAPNGHQTITEYGSGTSASTRWVKVRSQIDTNFWSEAISKYDGLGRTYKTQKIDSTGDVFTDTEYDTMGRVKRSTNPYKTGEALQWTTPEYDDLSRTKKVTSPDNTTVQFTFGLSTTGVIGLTKTATDQAGKKRRGITDALGRMVRVIEDPDGQSLVTDYVFDTIGNLRKTIQGEQSRYFLYNSTGRLLKARQVEQSANPAILGPSFVDSVTGNDQWSISYEYDNNGNITTTTDARNNTITGTYDRSNRLITRDYSDSTPDVNFYYDGTGLGSVPAYSKGKVTKVTSSVSENRNTSFDQMGRLLASQQITDGQTYTFGYSYNLSGALIEETYPSGRIVKNTLNNDGELSQVQSKKNSNYGFFTYAGSFTYNSAGAATKMQLGNGRWETAQFNDRLQVTQLGLGVTDNAQNLLKLEFGYGNSQENNGSMRSQTITVRSVGSNAGFVATQTYVYDNLNRIQSATETISGNQTWKQTFTIDRYGNRRFDAANTTTLGTCQQAVCNPTINTSDNRLVAGQGYSYNTSGSITQDAAGQRFEYDAADRQTQFFASTNGTSTPDATYQYDGEGKRVRKVNGSEVTVFVYDGMGKLVAEYSTTVVVQAEAKVRYLTTDHLGSPRIITDQNGTVISRKDFAAYGDEIVSSQRVGGPTGNGYDSPNVRQDYTGYQKDEESGLEFAQNRYYKTGHGRFTSVDPFTPSATIKNPQTFNRYSYVTNSPYKFTDPLGLMQSDASQNWLNVAGGFWGNDLNSGPLSAGQQIITAAMALYDRAMKDIQDAKRANALVKKGKIAEAQAIIDANENLEKVEARDAKSEVTVTVEATVNSPLDDNVPGNENVGIEVIIWDSFWTANPGNFASMYGHVSYIIDGYSYSFDNEGYHKQDPSKYTDERRKTSGGTGYVLDFGSADLNKKFKDSITGAYKNQDGSTQTWTPTNNCAYAFKAATNSIAGKLGVAPISTSTIKPATHGTYIQKTLKPYTTSINTYHYIKAQNSLK